MQNFQMSLFYNLQYTITTSSFHRKYYLLFQSLLLKEFSDRNCGHGRTGYSRRAILRAFIVKYLEGISSVPRLIEFLDAHPILAHMCGFNPGSLPNESQFYRFLKGTPNSVLEKIHTGLNRTLIKEGVISTDTFIMDSKPVLAATRENNLKNPNRNTRNKHKQPRRNPAASLGYYSYQEVNGKKAHYLFFWGYRTHVIVSKEGVPLISKTLPNNKTDAEVAKQLIKKLKLIFKFQNDSIFIGDAAYDERDIYNLIVNTMTSQAFIPINPRNQQPNKTFGPHGCPLCDANLEMKSTGSYTEGSRTRLKFRCPIKALRKVAVEYPDGCPIKHPRFINGKAYGCTKYLGITNDVRSRIPRDTDFYKKTYKLRMVVEQYFSRLGTREVEQTTHYKLRSVQNQMTIAHLSMSLVASAAALLMKRPDRIRCYRTFAKEPPVRQIA